MTKPTVPSTSVPRAYRRLLEAAGAHPDELPVEGEIERIPEIRRVRRRMLTLERKVQARHPDKSAFLRYADLRGELCSLRSEAQFDAGHERGRLMGHLERRELGVAGRVLVHEIVKTLSENRAPVAITAAALLDAARAVVLMQERQHSGRPRVVRGPAVRTGAGRAKTRR